MCIANATDDFYVNNIPRAELDVQRIANTLKVDVTLEPYEVLIRFEAGRPDRWLTPARTEAISDETRLPQRLHVGFPPRSR